ncbi:endonuclease/exonuclease/phosphatase family metal-dependent hydrolase [Ereboglobus sp. PH5-5]|uniref:endonuclease/exonuclease/phosphatase family protein n=1 Tax=Ereboglobus sp. PH5-5 TaxID=2940529 RepID=UPI00240528CC|nr:endonuclease/exonuclease/phosphatase family protein [Ereboglobus sp. PH5-5]MDF9832566.1 endonuclease/exonuclease/phosphatase family metal-dependent hydrolase [Ereboglobus sp. PH5-5]
MKSLQRILLPILSLALAANLAFAAAPGSDIPQRKRQSPDAVRVVSANIRFLVPEDDGTGNEWARRKELARDVLLAQDADIICFQEFRKAHLDFLKNFFPDYGGAGFVDGDDGQMANMIFYSKKRFEKIAHTGAFLSPTPEVYLSTFPNAPRTARHFNRLHLKDRLTGRELMIWNTHFSAGGKRQPARDAQAGVLADFLKKQPAAIPQIVTGDFNCTAKYNAYKSIKSAGFTDTHTALHGPADPGYTYHKFLGHAYGKTSGKIDFIFSNASLRPTVTEIIKDSRVTDGVRRYPSDHYFLSAEFEYAKKRP